MGGTQVHLVTLGRGYIDNLGSSSCLSRSASKPVYVLALNHGRDRMLRLLGKLLFGGSLYKSKLLLGHEYIGT
jgi:hypothetical protein